MSLTRKNILGTLLAVLAVVLALVVVRPAAAATPIRIMPLGDSITGSPGCWRALLWNKLQQNGYTNIDFVGTLGPQGCSVPYDGDNEGHGGALVTTVADQNQLPGWLSATHPDIVVMHFGTNDVWSNRSPDQILAAYSTLVDQMRASNPNMKVLVAQIIPMNPSTCPECAQRVKDLNARIPAWAAGKTTAKSPITVVDQWTGFNTATDTGDGVHPNDTGIVKISDRWYPALAAALSGTTPTQPPTSQPPTSQPPTSQPPTSQPPTSKPPTTQPPTSPPPAGSGCAASYTTVGSWQGGFQGEVAVRNSGTASISHWKVTMSFSGGEKITQIWNGTLTTSGSTNTVTDVGWNGALAAGTSTSFGFLGSTGGTPGTPTLSCTAS
ncbi:cellulose binding domain-containing protein [Peterkaempfera bronchialis]|uniref:Cellulose-binding protein n=1 Tax=Peterkaempfera bronchialis TaxID=2126346 RepID=A0A345SZ58_9ACTN|nr:cellulose binding domain-containing protein [Peterkaempfera bronchialis]AXI79013.1 cellulose-binding protein [Peterkaempfera bronchialis]